MNQRTYKRRRYATPGYSHRAAAIAPVLARIRERRRAMLTAGPTLWKINRILTSAAPRTRRTVRRMVAADLDGMRAAGEWTDLARLADFLSPYAQRVVQARCARRGSAA